MGGEFGLCASSKRLVALTDHILTVGAERETGREQKLRGGQCKCYGGCCWSRSKIEDDHLVLGRVGLLDEEMVVM